MSNIKYNQQTFDKIIKAVKKGATRSRAAMAGGIDTRTLQGWLSPLNDNPMLIDFRDRYFEAAVNYQETLTSMMNADEKNGFRAALEQLKALDEDYQSKVKLEISMTDQLIDLFMSMKDHMSALAFEEMKEAYRKVNLENSKGYG